MWFTIIIIIYSQTAWGVGHKRGHHLHCFLAHSTPELQRDLSLTSLSGSTETHHQYTDWKPGNFTDKHHHRKKWNQELLLLGAQELSKEVFSRVSACNGILLANTKISRLAAHELSWQNRVKANFFKSQRKSERRAINRHLLHGETAYITTYNRDIIIPCRHQFIFHYHENGRHRQIMTLGKKDLHTTVHCITVWLSDGLNSVPLLKQPTTYRYLQNISPPLTH